MKGKDMKTKHFFLKCSIPIALSYWFFDSVVHYLGYGELEFEIIPSDINEFWMRSVIFILLVAFGVFADYHTNKIIKKDVEKYDVYMAMLGATRFILHHFLNNIISFRSEAENSKDFNRDILEIYDQVIDDTIAKIKNLEDIKEPSKKTIEDKYRQK
jgi:hypothetical protein